MPTLPNILIVMADQLAARFTGAYGHPVVRTPALDALCAQGVRFDACYTPSPLCVPARAALFAGRYASHFGVFDNGNPFSSETPTFAHALRAQGYDVLSAGKLHFIGPDQLHGLERRLTTDIYPSGYQWMPDWATQRRQGIVNDKGALAAQSGPCAWNYQMAYDEEVHFRALEYLRGRAGAADRRPFCLMVSYTQPHAPYEARPPDWDRYADDDIDLPAVPHYPNPADTAMDRMLQQYEGIPAAERTPEVYRRMRRAYYAMVTDIDERLGALLACLEETGERADTAIIFCSDHGDMLGERGLTEKRCFYDAAARVPLIAAFPGRWQSGAKVAAPVSLLDLFPTLAALAGAEVPAGLDGRSLLGCLEGTAATDEERVVLTEYQGEGVTTPCFMACDARLKYVYVLDGGEQLFDVCADPHETRNLAADAACAAQVARLRGAILAAFAPSEIERRVLASQANRLLIRRAHRQAPPNAWDYQPFFDATRRYERPV